MSISGSALSSTMKFTVLFVFGRVSFLGSSFLVGGLTIATGAFETLSSGGMSAVLK